MFHYTFILCRQRRDWCLRPRFCLLEDGSWQWQWLCLYAHRIRIG